MLDGILLINFSLMDRLMDRLMDNELMDNGLMDNG